MNTLYILGGLVSLGVGLWITVIQIKTFIRKEQDSLGFDIKLLGGGIMAIGFGIALIAHFI